MCNIVVEINIVPDYVHVLDGVGDVPQKLQLYELLPINQIHTNSYNILIRLSNLWIWKLWNCCGSLSSMITTIVSFCTILCASLTPSPITTPHSSTSTCRSTTDHSSTPFCILRTHYQSSGPWLIGLWWARMSSKEGVIYLIVIVYWLYHHGHVVTAYICYSDDPTLCMDLF